MPSRTKLKGVAFGLGVVVAVVATIGLVVSVPVAGSYAGKAALVQRVQQDKTGGALFGDDSSYRDIGSPQQLIIEDPKAFLPGETSGVKRVDEDYLTSHRIYPLELQTVNYGVKLTRMGLGIALVLGIFLVAIFRKRT